MASAVIGPLLPLALVGLAIFIFLVVGGIGTVMLLYASGALVGEAGDVARAGAAGALDGFSAPFKILF